MESSHERPFLPQVQELIHELVPIIKKWEVGQYAISIGGSMGKGSWDPRSDVDFRLFHERDLPWPHVKPELWTEYYTAEERWRRKGINIDGVWPRSIAAIDAELNRWFDGEAAPEPLVWSIWGYHLLTDIRNQFVIEDPYGIIAGWKQRLQHYPPKLKAALLKKHMGSLRYWRHDYHYANKVQRGDVVFLAGISARLVHDVMQVLFAVNETYYVGDGQNLHFARSFKHQPDHLADRVRAILYPGSADDAFQIQYAALGSLIDEVLNLAAPFEAAQTLTNQASSSAQ